MSQSLSSFAKKLESIELKLQEHQDRVDKASTSYVSFSSNEFTIRDEHDNVLSHYTISEAPTLARFHAARGIRYHRLIMGPRGSGKSVACLHEIILMTIYSDPCVDGVKRARWLIGRRTYSELETTTIRTFEDWFKFEFIGHKGTKKPPRARLMFFDGKHRVEIEFIFMSFDTPDSAKQALSLELTGAYFNECNYIPQEVLNKIDGSITRYPARKMRKEGGTYHFGLLYDANAFPNYHPLYTRFMVEKHDNHEIFLQPGGMKEVEAGVFEENPEAENLRWLTEGYYKNMSIGKPFSFIRTQICNRFGEYEAGKACHPDYNQDIHSSEHIEINLDLPIYLGFDYGGTNACIVAQDTGHGLNIVKEFVNSVDSLSSFCYEVQEWLNVNCAGAEIKNCWGDPSNNKSISTATPSHDVVERVTGYKVVSAPSNVIKSRLEAVNLLLEKRLAGGKSSFLICRTKCPMLHAGMSGKYALEYKKVGDTSLPVEIPVKNEWSHPADALQYICLGHNDLSKRAKHQHISQDFKDLVGL
jgi:hypothetical protein